MSGKLHLICMKTEGFHAKIRCNLNENFLPLSHPFLTPIKFTA